MKKTWYIIINALSQQNSQNVGFYKNLKKSLNRRHLGHRSYYYLNNEAFNLPSTSTSFRFSCILELSGPGQLGRTMHKQHPAISYWHSLWTIPSCLSSRKGLSSLLAKSSANFWRIDFRRPQNHLYQQLLGKILQLK